VIQGIQGDPSVIAAMGDSHGHTHAVVRGIQAGAELLPTTGPRVFLHFGDFGFYPLAYYIRYLRAVSGALAAAGAVMWVIDGNHEDHNLLAGVAASAEDRGHGPPYMVASHIYWLPRGYRWTWAGRTWVAAGGAVSLNRAQLTPGLDWFPEESLSPADVQAITGPGPADVIVSHDAPSGVHLSMPPPMPGWDLADVAKSDAHRDVLQRIGTVLQPRYWMHGHLHMAYQRETDLGWGPVQVTGLDCDGDPAGPPRINTAVIDLATMTWTPYPVDLSREHAR
jgi:hypothetical protein